MDEKGGKMGFHMEPLSSAGFMKLVALSKVGELAYSASTRVEGMEEVREYYLTASGTEDNLVLKVRVVEMERAMDSEKLRPKDARIIEFNVGSDMVLGAEDEGLLYIWGMVPITGGGGAIEEGEWDDVDVKGMAGRYRVKLSKKANPLGSYTLSMELIRTRFMPEGFLNESEYDFATGLLLSFTRVDKTGFKNMELIGLSKN